MPSPAYTRADYQRAADTIRQATAHQPTVGLILGSGLATLAEQVESAVAIPYEQIPMFPRSTVQGHPGRVVIGRLENQTVMILQGRFHFYEGYSMQEVTFPIRVMQMLGIKTLIVTNAAGGINTSFKGEDLMLITDHINLIGMAGNSPLVGPNDNSLGERFFGLTSAYDLDLCALARRVASEAGITLREGVYACLAGPSFETPAEIRMLRAWGADAVGMSTAPEVVVARHAQMRVMGVSSITNMTIDKVGGQSESADLHVHMEVLDASTRIVPRLAALIRGVLAAIGPA
jgi:purine-nucleoside phosphorylase